MPCPLRMIVCQQQPAGQQVQTYVAVGKVLKRLEAARVARVKKAVQTLKAADADARKMFVADLTGELRDLSQVASDLLIPKDTDEEPKEE